MLGYLTVTLVVAYLIGAIPVGAIVAGVNHVDINQQGSGKMGTTNVLRTVGRRAAAMVLVGDYAKGAVAVLVAHWLAGAFVGTTGSVSIFGLNVLVFTVGSLVAAVGAVAGHIWSIYLRVINGKWGGGRGVATAQGAILVVNPIVLLAALLVGIPTILLSRYVSLGSIMGAVAGGVAIIVLVALGQMDILSILFLSLCVFVIAAHHDNIERLLKGTERKIGERAKV